MTRSPSHEPVPPMQGQPYLFDLVSIVNAPSLVLSAHDGQIVEGGVQGWMCADRRFLSRLQVMVNGIEPTGLRGSSEGVAVGEFRGVLAGLGDPIAEPTIFLDRRRELRQRELVETLTLSSAARHPAELVLSVALGADLSTMAAVKLGAPETAPPATVDGSELRWVRGGNAAAVRAEPPPDHVYVDRATLSWSVQLAPGEAITVRLRATATASKPDEFAGVGSMPWQRPTVTCADRRLPSLLHRGLDDLGGLLLRDDAHVGHDDMFVAAGSPWFLTLFGRDSLWTARMLLPLDTDLAMSTLRVLARRQGTDEDPRTEEQPGRILHEVRSEPLALQHATLPPVYYGSVDATPLFVICLAEAWRWGADPREVEQLLPAMQRCLRWMEQQAGDGFIRYVDTTGQGLSNQGWKDSEDSIQWADGSLAVPPIALSEVQAYAFQAAMLGADLLDDFGLPDGARWRQWAKSLAERFRAAFWVGSAESRYPAIALDADGAAVDSVASNMGHLLATGLLTPDEEELVARRLAAPDMDSGFGLRTISARTPTYSRLSYHGGAVWPHDTAIAVMGLAGAGFGDEATSLLRGLVRAAPHFDFRLPELYGGDDGEQVDAPMPYPAACRPQAWSAAGPVAALTALLGLQVDAPGGTVAVRPVLGDGLLDDWLLPLSVSGLRIGQHDLAVNVDRGGVASVETDHPAISVMTGLSGD